MAQRVQAVAKIAEHKRTQAACGSRGADVPARVASATRIAGFGAKKRRLEGFLFPATYDFLRNTTSTAARAAAARRRSQRTGARSTCAYARKKNLTPYDVLIIASLVEKEALVPDERPKIARVIYNRLHAGMNLGIDATTRYGLHVPGRSRSRSPSSTATTPTTRGTAHTGLPPTPIANPGLASMQAAAHPAAGDWLYFVRKPDHQHHYFTDNYNDFINHANQYGFY